MQSTSDTRTPVRRVAWALLLLAAASLVSMLVWAALPDAGPSESGQSGKTAPLAAALASVTLVGAFGAVASDGGLCGLITKAASKVRPGELALLFIAWLGVVALFGSHLASDPTAAFDVDREFNLASASSSAMLLAAAVLALVIAERRESAGLPVRVARWLAVLLLFMAVDESATVHENVELQAEIGWQTLYLPLIAAASIVWLLALRHLVLSQTARLLFAAAAPLWAAAPLLEELEFVGPFHSSRMVDSYKLLIAIEELSELAGAACFVLALLLTLQRLTSSSAAGIRRRAVGMATLVAGAGLAVGVVTADLLQSGGDPGFGTKQQLGLAVGAALALVGTTLVLTRRRTGGGRLRRGGLALRR
jgi:hypothetical protein